MNSVRTCQWMDEMGIGGSPGSGAFYDIIPIAPYVLLIQISAQAFSTPLHFLLSSTSGKDLAVLCFVPPFHSFFSSPFFIQCAVFSPETEMYGMQSQVDGASLFSGGGFMPSQATQVNESGFSSVRKSGNSSGLLPLTVKQISQATQKLSDENSNFIIDGVDVNNVTLVGMVFNKEERVTDVSFLLDDGTGRMEVKRWVNDSMESAEMASVQNCSYVRVHGHLRSFQGKKHVNAFSVRPVTDFNEITFHFLECIFVHLYNLKVQGGSATQTNPVSPAVKGGSMGPPTGLSHATPHNQYVASAPLSMGGSLGGSKEEFHKRVHAVFLEPANLGIEQGVHVDDVARRLPGFPKKQVRDAIEFLVNEGYIYSTIDEDHFKSTDA